MHNTNHKLTKSLHLLVAVVLSAAYGYSQQSAFQLNDLGVFKKRGVDLMKAVIRLLSG